MKEMKTVDAVGQVLCHDITQIIKDVSKGPVFRKGHIIREEDIPVLLSVGKDHIYIWEHDDTMLHENDGARILCDLCSGSNIAHADDIKEGKIEFTAGCDGLLKVDTERLNKINSLGEMMIATIHGNFPVKKGDKLGGTRVIPLVISKEKMEKAAATVEGAHILNILPYQQRKAGIVTTGNEVYYGRIEDTFTEVVISKLRAFGVEIVGHEISSDDLFANVLAASETDGKIYQFPLAVKAIGIIARKSDVGADQYGFTFKQYKEFVKGPCNGCTSCSAHCSGMSL